MCGICGYIDFNSNTSDDVLIKMIESLKHRGPDATGKITYERDSAKIGLGHSRLAIIDLSINGRQPINFKNLTLLINGEIYNYLEIRKNLLELGHQFISSSDSEVAIHAIHEWGMDALNSFIGMFAIAIYNHDDNNLTLVRDRAGVKPIFYYWNSGLFLMGSELKAFHQHPAFKPGINDIALRQYFTYGYIPAPMAIFNHCHKLLPGHFLNFNLENKQISITKYWSVDKFYCFKKSDHSYNEAKQHLVKLLKSASDYRMIADVPVGIFLSGGYDSSLVTALIQEDRTQKVKTYTIGFNEGNNEAPFAKEVANYLGTEHNEYICTYQDAKDIIPLLPHIYDEPFSDSSAIPTILLSKVAKRDVTVALSADAGDEVFAGYTRYQSLQRKLRLISGIPDFTIPYLIKFIPQFQKLIPDKYTAFNHKLHGISQALARDKNSLAAYLFMQMHSLPKNNLNNLFNQPVVIPDPVYNLEIIRFREELETAFAIDYQLYLQNDILQKVDRATMAASLEGREPLLDHRLIEYAAQLPVEYKYSKVTGGKRILKDIVHDMIPSQIMDRPKAGFSIPLNDWLKGDLSYLIDHFLHPGEIRKHNMFNESFVSNQVRLFKEHKLHYSIIIWRLLVFQMWYKKWVN